MESPWALRSDKQELNHNCCFLRQVCFSSPDYSVYAFSWSQGCGKVKQAHASKFLEHCMCLVKRKDQKECNPTCFEKLSLDFTALVLASFCLLVFLLGHSWFSCFPSSYSSSTLYPIFFYFPFLYHHPLTIWSPRESQQEDLSSLSFSSLLLWIWIVSPETQMLCLTPGTSGYGTYLETSHCKCS